MLLVSTNHFGVQWTKNHQMLQLGDLAAIRTRCQQLNCMRDSGNIISVLSDCSSAQQLNQWHPFVTETLKTMIPRGTL